MNAHSLHIAAWEQELPLRYPGREYLLDGIKNGFNIVDIDDLPNKYVEVANYRSATGHENRDKVSRQIMTELDHGHYIIAQERPRIISALGAIPKKPNNIRLIHDCSMPEGGALNDYATLTPFKFQGIQDAVAMISPNCYMCKCDLSSAYRVVKIHPSNYTATGLKYRLPGHTEETVMVDTRLPFGASRSVGIFHSLTQAVCSIMAAKYGMCKIVAYIDDFLIVCQSRDQALETLNTLIALLRKLGFWINYNKVVGPATRLTFLGVILDSVQMTMELPQDKVHDLKTALISSLNKPKWSKQYIQHITGKLSWATQCIYGGRFFLRRLLDSMLPLKKPWHRTRLTAAMKADIAWWLEYIDTFNGTVRLVDNRPTTPMFIDACPVAAGAYYEGRCVYTPWDSMWPEAKHHHINYKEVMALEPAIAHFAPLLQNKIVYVHTDNQAAMYIINKGTCKDKLTMQSLRRVFWYSAIFNFRIQAIYLPGKSNVLADAVSRSHEPSMLSFITNHLMYFWHLQEPQDVWKNAWIDEWPTTRLNATPAERTKRTIRTVSPI